MSRPWVRINKIINLELTQDFRVPSRRATIVRADFKRKDRLVRRASTNLRGDAIHRVPFRQSNLETIRGTSIAVGVESERLGKRIR